MASPRNESASDTVFVDSSVLIAAAISATGPARQLLLYGIRHRLTLTISPLVLEETERNLARKAPQALPAFQVLRDLVGFDLVRPPHSLVEEVADTIEPKDAAIVAGALSANATFLATYDRRHLLNHRQEIKARFEVTVDLPEAIILKARLSLAA